MEQWARKNNMPKDLYKIKLKKNEYRIRSCNGILILKWKDKWDVYILSSKHETAEMSEPDKNQFYCTLKPKYVIEYNKRMIGIDLYASVFVFFWWGNVWKDIEKFSFTYIALILLLYFIQ